MLEKRSIDYIPLVERHGQAWHLWPVWFAGSAHLATLAVGVIGIALGGNLLWTMIAVVAGGGLGTFFMAFHSTQGPQLGLPQMIQSRPQFGYMGALLVWAVALISYIGYNAFNQVLAAQAIAQLAGPHAPPAAVSILVFAGAAAILAAVGYDWIHTTQRGLAFLLLALLTVYSIGAILHTRFPAAQWNVRDFRATPFITQFFAAAAYQLSWSIYVSDYSRYLPREVGVRATFWWTYLGAFIGGAWMMLIGTVAATLYPRLDIAAAMASAADGVVAGLGRPLVVGGLLGLTTISALNVYGASLTLLSAVDSFHPLRGSVTNRVASLAFATIMATAIALLSTHHFIERFGDLLAVLLYLFTPWTAINLVDFYIVRRGHYSVREIFNPHGLYGRWNWRGLLAYGTGFIAMTPFFSTGIYTGPVARLLGGADVGMLIGLPVSAAVYLIACRSMDMEREFCWAAAADEGIEAPVHASLSRQVGAPC
jgi:NCS1 family nucleobase:cation symporter-1